MLSAISPRRKYVNRTEPPASRPATAPGGGTRRRTVGRIPGSSTLTYMMASAAAADAMVSSSGRSRFGAHFIQPDYRLSWSAQI